VVAALIVVIGLWFGTLWRAPKFEPASKEKMAYPLPDKLLSRSFPLTTSAVILTDYLADAITENIISYLSKHPAMFVIDASQPLLIKASM